MCLTTDILYCLGCGKAAIILEPCNTMIFDVQNLPNSVPSSFRAKPTSFYLPDDNEKFARFIEDFKEWGYECRESSSLEMGYCRPCEQLLKVYRFCGMADPEGELRLHRMTRSLNLSPTRSDQRAGEGVANSEQGSPGARHTVGAEVRQIGRNSLSSAGSSLHSSSPTRTDSRTPLLMK